MTESNMPAPAARLGFISLVALLFVGGIVGGVAWSRREHAVASEPAPVTSSPVAAATPSKAPEEIALQTETARELRALRAELAELRHHEAATERRERPARAAQPEREDPSVAIGQATLAYWNQLNDIMIREAAMRAAPPKLTAGNAMSFVTGQSDAYEFAAKAIRRLDAAQVDPRVRALADEIAVWYDQGAVNSREASSLLQNNDVATRQGQAGKSWKSGAESHRKQCLEINARGEKLRSELSRTYGLAFPKLQ
jgi:hypothetical protein